MQELKQDLRDHMAEDREDFKAINDKLDQQTKVLYQIKGQWKLVGGAVGAALGLASGWFF